MDPQVFWESVQQWALMHGPRILIALLLLLVGLFLASKLSNYASKKLGGGRLDDVVVRFVQRILHIALVLIVLIAVLNQLGLPVASLVAVLGAAGLAVALALKSSLENLAAGIMIASMGYFRKGDYIEVSGASGSVEHINLFTTELRTPDNKKVIVPNGQIINSEVTNHSFHDTRRIEIIVGVSYDDDLSKVHDTLAKIIQDDEAILPEPEALIAVHSMGDNSVNFMIRPWVNTPDLWPTYWRLQGEIKRRFDSADISIPFPQRDVHLIQAEPARLSDASEPS